MIQSRTLLSLAASAAFCCSLPGAALPGERSPGEEPVLEYESQIVWYDHDPTIPLFLPQSELHSTSLEELHFLSPSQRIMLEAAVRFGEEQMDSHMDRKCYHQPGPVDPPAKDRPEVAEWLSKADLALIGTVVATVPGWSTSRSRPVTMIYTRVDEIVRDVRNVIHIGQAVAFAQVEARIDLFGVEACSKLPPGFDSFAVGDEVLIDGAMYGDHPFYVAVAHAFPVRDGEVIPQPSGLIQALEAPRSLRELKSAVPPGGGR